jgi:hypothetical protein
MSNKEIELPRKLRLLYEALNGKGDVAIDTLYDLLFEGENRAEDKRNQQQWLGPVIVRLNRRLPDEAVKPGALKGTYRLTSI